MDLQRKFESNAGLSPKPIRGILKQIHFLISCYAKENMKFFVGAKVVERDFTVPVFLSP